MKSLLGQLRIFAILEGVSYLLLALTMPLKYIYGIKGPNYVVGMAHGFLFISYVILVLLNSYDKKWGLKITLILLLASIIPFGTFWADSKILRSQKA